MLVCAGPDVVRAMPGTYTRSVSTKVGDAFGASLFATWRRQAVIECYPGQLHFGMITPGGEAITLQTVVKSTQGRAFRLTALKSDNGMLTLREPRGSDANESHELELTPNIPESAGSLALNDSVEIKTDLADCPTVRIPWSVFLRSARPDVSTPRRSIPASQ